MSKKILVVEDEPELAEIYLIRFSSLGYDVRLAFDGEAFYESVKTFIPDLIILDLLLPKINGLKILSDVKKNSELVHTKVVVISNLGNQYEIMQGKNLGADLYIVKSSINMKELVEKVHVLLK